MKTTKRFLKATLVFCFLLMSLNALAQEPSQPQSIEPIPVEIEATDGLILRGAYFVPHEGDAPAVLLLHQLYANRHSWNSLIQPLMEAGYRVLAVDLRGYGTTRGRINWKAAHDDTQRWSEWLATQPGVVSVQMGGSSMGSTLALNGCVAFAGCKGVVAISPSLNYYGYSTEEAFTSDRPKLVVYAESDSYPAQAMPTIQEISVNVEYLAYPGRAHGISLFRGDEDLIPQIVAWFNQHR